MPSRPSSPTTIAPERIVEVQDNAFSTARPAEARHHINYILRNVRAGNSERLQSVFGHPQSFSSEKNSAVANPSGQKINVIDKNAWNDAAPEGKFRDYPATAPDKSPSTNRPKFPNGRSKRDGKVALQNQGGCPCANGSPNGLDGIGLGREEGGAVAEIVIEGTAESWHIDCMIAMAFGSKA